MGEITNRYVDYDSMIAVTSSSGEVVKLLSSTDIVSIWCNQIDSNYPYTIKIVKENIPYYYNITTNGFRIINRHNHFQPTMKNKNMIIFESVEDLLTINRIRNDNLTDGDYDNIFLLEPFRKLGSKHYPDGRASLFFFHNQLKKYLAVYGKQTKETIKKMDDTFTKYIDVNKLHLENFFNITGDKRLLEKEMWNGVADVGKYNSVC